MIPQISLIMVNRNRAAYLAEAINSVFRQTFSNWELIIIDDASDDASREIIAGFLGDKRLRFSAHSKRQGIGASRREAVQLAQAPVIGILDSDDALKDTALEIMVKAHQENSCGLIYSQYQICRADLTPLRLGTNGPLPLAASNLEANRISHFFTFKKSAYEKTAGYDPGLNLAEDKDLFYKLEEVSSCLFIDQALYRYRLHPQGISSAGWFKQARAHFYHFLVRRRALKRRGQSLRRRLINQIKHLLDRRYFPVLTPGAIRKFRQQDGQTKNRADYWHLANSFSYGPPLRGFNLNIRPAQLEAEILALLAEVAALRPRLVLEIGTATGGTLYLWTKLADPKAQIISLDLPGGRFGGGYLSSRQKLLEAFPGPSQTLSLLRADSHHPDTKQAIMKLLNGQPLDFLFIDGDHSYEGVKADWDNFSPLVRPGGLAALHDIAKNHTDHASQVDRFWQELKQRYETTEIIAAPEQGWAGIGLVKL